MLMKDKDVLANTIYSDNPKIKIKNENMRSAWGDIFDYYLRDITARYLKFSGRASRLEFWGFILVSGLVFLLIYPLGLYVDIPMLAYYYFFAVLLPTLAIFARRLHDLNKNAILYLGILGLACVSILFIGYWAVILILGWSGFLIWLLFKESDMREGLYGAPLESDEKYDADNLPILKKFRMLALCILAINLSITLISFNDWRVQAEFMGTKEQIMEQIEKDGKKAQLTDEQIEAAKNIMKQQLKEWSGTTVQPDDITKAIQKSIQSVKPIVNAPIVPGAPNVAVIPAQVK